MWSLSERLTRLLYKHLWGEKNSISLADRSSSWHEILYKHFVTVQKYSINIQIQHRQKKKRKKGTLIHCQFSSPRNENEVIRLWCADRISGNISGASRRKTTVKHFPEQLQNKSRPKSESLQWDFVRLKLHPRPGSRSSTHFWQDELLAQKLQRRFQLHRRCKKCLFKSFLGSQVLDYAGRAVWSHSVFSLVVF